MLWKSPTHPASTRPVEAPFDRQYIHHLVGDFPHRALHDLSRRYGAIMFLKFGEAPSIIISSPDAAKDVMKTQDTIFATRPRSEILKIIRRKGQSLVLSPYGEQWRELRKICIRELLSTKHVSPFRPIRYKQDYYYFLIMICYYN